MELGIWGKGHFAKSVTNSKIFWWRTVLDVSFQIKQNLVQKTIFEEKKYADFSQHPHQQSTISNCFCSTALYLDLANVFAK